MKREICDVTLREMKGEEVFGMMKCLPWRSQLINGCGAQEESCFCVNPESLFLTHGQYQLFGSCFSVRSAHTGNDSTGDKHLQSIWCQFDVPLQSQRKYKSKEETSLAPHTCSCQSSCDFCYSKKNCFPISLRDEQVTVLNGVSQLLSGFCASSSTISNPSCPILTVTQWPYRFLVCEIRLSQPTCSFLLLHQWYLKGWRSLCSCDRQYPNPMQVPKLRSEKSPITGILSAFCQN